MGVDCRHGLSIAPLGIGEEQAKRPIETLLDYMSESGPNLTSVIPPVMPAIDARADKRRS
jgi:hypothetical protein